MLDADDSTSNQANTVGMPSVEMSNALGHQDKILETIRTHQILGYVYGKELMDSFVSDIEEVFDILETDFQQVSGDRSFIEGLTVGISKYIHKLRQEESSNLTDADVDIGNSIAGLTRKLIRIGIGTFKLDEDASNLNIVGLNLEEEVEKIQSNQSYEWGNRIGLELINRFIRNINLTYTQLLINEMLDPSRIDENFYTSFQKGALEYLEYKLKGYDVTDDQLLAASNSFKVSIQILDDINAGLKKDMPIFPEVREVAEHVLYETNNSARVDDLLDELKKDQIINYSAFDYIKKVFLEDQLLNIERILSMLDILPDYLWNQIASYKLLNRLKGFPSYLGWDQIKMLGFIKRNVTLELREAGFKPNTYEVNQLVNKLCTVYNDYLNERLGDAHES